MVPTAPLAMRPAKVESAWFSPTTSVAAVEECVLLTVPAPVKAATRCVKLLRETVFPACTSKLEKGENDWVAPARKVPFVTVVAPVYVETAELSTTTPEPALVRP